MRIGHFWMGTVPRCCASILLLAAPGLAQPLNFNAPKTFGAYGSNSTVVADFNGDGIPDIAAALSGYGTFEILLGKGDGAFQVRAPAYPRASDTLIYLAAGDFNGDGIADLAVAGGGFNVSILLGNGDGTFQPPKSYSAGYYLSSIAVADFNGDGKLDVAVTDMNAEPYSHNVYILLGNGDGTLQEAVPYPVLENPASVAVGDFNGDGKPDLAVANEGSGAISILLGNGDGSFQPQVPYAAQRFPISVAVGDFNGDGKADLAVANWGSNNVSILLGNGDGTFQPQVAYGVSGAPSSSPMGVAVADLNGDGKPDLAVANNEIAGTTAVLLGNGDGTFQAAVTYLPGGSAVAIADFNGDGKPDLAVGENSVTILLGKGSGTFERAVNYAVLKSPESVVVGDFNGDGRPDVAVADYYSNTVSILLNNAEGGFLPRASYAVLDGPDSIAVGDFNGDGKPDLAVVDSLSEAVSILLGNGDGTFKLSGSFAVGYGAQSIAVGDFNGDGKPDLAVVNHGVCTNCHVSPEYSANSVSILLGNGDGTFQPQVPYLNGDQPTFVAVGDFNGDGKPDLAVALASYLLVLPGEGNGAFGTPIATPAILDSGSPIAVADLNGDGKPDLVIKGLVLLGNGDGTFEVGQNLRVLGYEDQAAVADFNGDGKPDIAETASGGIFVYLGNGDGTFTFAMAFCAGNEPLSVAAADFNRDGKPDLAVANANSGNVPGNVALLTNATP